jgi:putative ABC transport system ATP-binding protein
MENMSRVLEFQNVSKVYEGPPPVKAVHSVSFAIGKGEFTAFVGPSGSGKSTLLNLAAALDTPSEGEVILAGKKLSRVGKKEAALVRRTSLGFIFQAYNLFPTLTALENVEFTSLVRGDSTRDVRTRSLQALQDVGLGGLGPRFPNQLSGGQQQRVAVARALASLPELILADEPTANLDSKTADQLIDLFEQLNRERNVTFLLSSHDTRLVQRARRRLIIRDGEILSDEGEKK